MHAHHTYLGSNTKPGLSNLVLSLHLIKEHIPFITFFQVNGEKIFQSPFMTFAGFLFQLFC